MIRILILLVMSGTLASCAQYQEPQANCFALFATEASVGPKCHFAPLGTPEDDIDV